MNPEFKRNIWQELSTQRLIALPAILVAVFFIAYLKGGFSLIPDTALSALFLLLVVWGTSLAADAIFSEIQDHTWNSQKMTPLGPWSMTWGKLFGSTIFVWYGAFWCLIAVWWGARQALELDLGGYSSIAHKSTYYILVGLFTQAWALFSALLFQRISPLRSRSKVGFIQLLAIFTGFLLFIIGKNVVPALFSVDSWYHLGITPEHFTLASIFFFFVSLVFGIYRLLRTELQMRTFPWAWPVFMLIWIMYVYGFFQAAPSPTAEVPYHWKRFIYLSIAYFMLLKGTFLAAFFAPKNIIQYFRCLRYLKASHYKRSLSLTPAWVITLLLAALLILPVSYTQQQLEFLAPSTRMMATSLSLSAFFFLLRDLGLLYYLAFDFQAKRAHLASIVYLAVLYTLLPMLLSFTELPLYWLPAFAPWAWFNQPEIITWTQIIAVTFLVGIQAVIAWWLVVTRWRQALGRLT